MSTPSPTGRIFLVDTEATNRSPHSGVMSEFGVVHFDTGATFHGTLYDSQWVEGTPRPVLTVGPGPRYQRDTDPAPILTKEGYNDLLRRFWVMEALTQWMKDIDVPTGTMFSDNPVFDGAWMTYAFDEAGIDNPFGFSGRRIGDLFAGFKGNWRDANSWKRWRRTKHTHHPVDDARGNAEALHHLLVKYDQIEA